MMFWIEFDLLFAFLFMQVITIVLCIVMDFISTFFCMQVCIMWITCMKKKAKFKCRRG